MQRRKVGVKKKKWGGKESESGEGRAWLTRGVDGDPRRYEVKSSKGEGRGTEPTSRNVR